MSRMQTAKLMIATNPYVYELMRGGKYNDLVWASDNLETVAHYYEGTVVEIEVYLNKSRQRQYLRSTALLHRYRRPYGWGCAEMKCPEGAIWYSFSREYLHEYLISMREIFPDLSPWNEEDD